MWGHFLLSITYYLGDKTNPHLAAHSFRGVVESGKVTPSLLKTKQPQVPQVLLTGLLLQILHSHQCPSLDILQALNDILVMTDPEQNTGFEVQPH